MLFFPQPGFLYGVLSLIRAKTASSPNTERMCALVLDEMTVKAHLDYNIRLDSIDGLTSSGRPATQAMVFMARGICAKWKQVCTTVVTHKNSQHTTPTDCPYNPLSPPFLVRQLPSLCATAPWLAVRSPRELKRPSSYWKVLDSRFVRLDKCPLTYDFTNL